MMRDDEGEVPGCHNRRRVFMGDIRLMQIVFAAALVPVCGCGRSGDPGVVHAPTSIAGRADSEREVLAAEREWVRVAIAGDADAFASFLADHYVEMNPDGSFVDKATWTEGIRSGSSHYDSVVLSDVHVRFPTPNVAVVTGAYTQKAVSNGKDNSDSGVYVNTWVRIGGRWQVVSSGFAPSPTAPK